jgi:hypothetical protein
MLTENRWANFLSLISAAREISGFFSHGSQGAADGVVRRTIAEFMWRPRGRKTLTKRFSAVWHPIAARPTT